MKVERIDGVEYEFDTDAHKAAVKRRDEAERTRAKTDADTADRITRLEAQVKAGAEALDRLPKLEARADAAESSQKKLADENAALKDPKRLDEAVNARLSLVSGARKILGADAKLDGKSEAEIKTAAVAHRYPDFRLDGKSNDYINAMFDIAVSKSDEESDGLAALRADAETVSRGDLADEYDEETYLAKSKSTIANLWKSPAARGAVKE